MKRVNGMIRNAETVELVDPWGNYYDVFIDLDLDGKLENPNSEDVASGTTQLHKSAIVFSAGKDRKKETWKDNVGSWNSAK